MAPPSMCVSSATTMHRSGTLLYRRLWSSAAWAHRSCASRSTFLTENPIALSIREREEMLWGQDASKSGKVIKREKIDFISRRKTSGCDRTRLSKARKKGAWKRAASTCLFSRTGSLHGDPPRTKLFHHPIAAALLHPQCSMIESQLRPRWRLRITCQRTARGNMLARKDGSSRSPVVFTGGLGHLLPHHLWRCRVWGKIVAGVGKVVPGPPRRRA